MVKASAQITMSKVIDIYACYRYYKLQSSTLAKPAKPTTNPPSGWSDTEPAYDSGSTNTLYFVDCNVYSDLTFSFSEVSKSTSYEAAKDAWNKANNAQNTADSKPDMSDVGDYVASRGENLVTNGTCLLGDNTNFSSFTYDGSDTYYAGGSFKISSTSTSGNIVVCDEFIPVDTVSKYLFSYWIKTSNALARYYDFIASYDIDKKSIYAAHVMWIAGSTTTLAKELKNGDTVIYLTSAAGFNATTTNDYQKGLIFWNYKNSKGYTYGPETYSQNRWDSLWGDGSAIDKSNNTITLKTAWTHGTFPAGTSVSQCSNGRSYTYLNDDFTLPAANTWIHKTGTVCGVGKNDASGKFREGTAFVKVGWITNRDVSSGATCWLSTISLTQNVGLADVIKSVDVEYYLSTSATSLSGGSWSTTAPTWVDGKYMWSRTVTVDGTGSKTYSPNQNGVCIAGAKGSTGAAGKGVTSIVEQYYKSTSATSLTGGSWSTTYPGWENGKYIWTRSVITYTDKTTTTTTAVCVTGTKGDTGATGKGVKSSAVTYQASTSGTTIPTGTWSTTIPSVAAGSFLWTKTVITYTDNTTTTSYSVGKMGNTGSKGETGKGIKSTAVTYQAGSSGTTAPTETWTSEVPATSADKPYLWSKTVITYTDDTTSTTYSVGSTPEGVVVGGRNLAKKGCIKKYGTASNTSVNDSNFLINGGFTFSRTAVKNEGPMIDNGMPIVKGTSYVTNFRMKFNTDQVSSITVNNGHGHINTKVYIDDVYKGTFNTAIAFPTDLAEHKVTLYYTANADRSPATTDASTVHTILQPDKTGTIAYTATVTYFKTEIGNKATDWTPAPEDMLSKDEAKDVYTTQLEMSKTNRELRLDFTKSIVSATDDMQSKLDAANDATDQKFGEISKYIRFVDGKIVLGETGSELTLTVQNDRVSFQQDGNEVAYFSNNNLYIRRAEVLTTLKVGNYEFAPRNDGGLALRKRGN